MRLLLLRGRRCHGSRSDLSLHPCYHIGIRALVYKLRPNNWAVGDCASETFLARSLPMTLPNARIPRASEVIITLVACKNYFAKLTDTVASFYRWYGSVRNFHRSTPRLRFGFCWALWTFMNYIFFRILCTKYYLNRLIFDWVARNKKGRGFLKRAEV